MLTIPKPVVPPPLVNTLRPPRGPAPEFGNHCLIFNLIEHEKKMIKRCWEDCRPCLYETHHCEKY